MNGDAIGLGETGLGWGWVVRWVSIGRHELSVPGGRVVAAGTYDACVAAFRLLEHRR